MHHHCTIASTLSEHSMQTIELDEQQLLDYCIHHFTTHTGFPKSLIIPVSIKAGRCNSVTINMVLYVCLDTCFHLTLKECINDLFLGSDTCIRANSLWLIGFCKIDLWLHVAIKFSRAICLDLTWLYLCFMLGITCETTRYAPWHAQHAQLILIALHMSLHWV